MSRRLNFRVDHDVCVGNAMCRAIAGKVFVSDPKGQSVVADPTAERLARILEAAADCPVAAISVEDAETHEQLEF
jgi:ferredoxin